MGFAMREQLVARLGIAENPGYFLTVAIEVEEVGLAITPDGKITRYNLNGTAHFELVSVNGGEPVISDSTRTFTAYSATGSAYATRVAEQEARRRLAVTLADRIATQLAVTANRWLE